MIDEKEIRNEPKIYKVLDHFGTVLSRVNTNLDILTRTGGRWP